MESQINNMKNLDKKNSFKTPVGYFEGFTERLLNKITDTEAAAKQTIIPKEEGFVVPEAYFDDLHENIKQKLAKKEAKVVQMWPIRKYYLVAASVAAVALVLFGINWNTSKEVSFEDLANTDIETYFENNGLGLTTYEIAEVIPVDDLEIGDILENGMDEEKLIEYLNNNIDDFEQLNLDSDE